jgi:invasion protein IalB
MSVTRSRFWLVLVAALLGAVAAGPAEAASKNGQRFGSWVIRCPDKAKDDCLLVQTLAMSGGNRLMELSIGRVGTKGEHGALTMLPLGLHIPSGVIMVVDGKKQIPMTLLKCIQEGCQAVVPLDKTNIDLVRKAKSIDIGMVDEFSRKALTIGLDMEGLPAGLDALK